MRTVRVIPAFLSLLALAGAAEAQTQPWQVRPDDPGFAVFGRVIEGMDVARRILAAPKSATEGEGDMRGQMLEPRVQILSATRVISSSTPE